MTIPNFLGALIIALLVEVLAINLHLMHPIALAILFFWGLVLYGLRHDP